MFTSNKRLKTTVKEPPKSVQSRPKVVYCAVYDLTNLPPELIRIIVQYASIFGFDVQMEELVSPGKLKIEFVLLPGVGCMSLFDDGAALIKYDTKRVEVCSTRAGLPLMSSLSIDASSPYHPYIDNKTDRLCGIVYRDREIQRAQKWNGETNSWSDARVDDFDEMDIPGRSVICQKFDWLRTSPPHELDEKWAWSFSLDASLKFEECHSYCAGIWILSRMSTPEGPFVWSKVLPGPINNFGLLFDGVLFCRGHQSEPSYCYLIDTETGKSVEVHLPEINQRSTYVFTQCHNGCVLFEDYASSQTEGAFLRISLDC
jgi:hypothetical protein